MALASQLFAMVLLAVLALSAGNSSVSAQPLDTVKRAALVVGNGSYPSAPLPTANRDAAAFADLLRELGFTVTFAEDLSQDALRSAIRRFVAEAGEDTLKLFYYSGYALQVAKDNYLLPVDAEPRSPLEARNVGVGIEPLMAPGTMIVLDASRANPLEQAFRGFSAGLATIAPPDAVIVALSTGPGRIVPDYDGSLSLFTGVLIDALRESGNDLTRAMDLAHARIEAVSLGQQVPQTDGQLSDVLATLAPAPEVLGRPATGRMMLPRPKPDRTAPAPETTPIASFDAEPEPEETDSTPPSEMPAQGDVGGPASLEPDAFELAFWETIQNSRNPADFQAYLDAYPNGHFVPLARLRARTASGGGGGAAPPSPAREERQVADARSSAPGTETRQASVRQSLSPSGFGTTSAGPVDVSAGETFRDCDECPELVVVPAGSFEMGTSGASRFEQPARRVTISQPFAIGRSEVTFDEWGACVADGRCDYEPDTRGWGGGERPVMNLSWDDTQGFIAWLSDRTGQAYRLPTEAEWEYATRAGTQSAFWWGETANPVNANCSGCGASPKPQTLPARGQPANPFGLFGVAGNVAEWVEDCWHADYRGAPTDGSAWLEDRCTERVLRGGSFASGADATRSAARYKYDQDVRYYSNGFRVARDVE